MEPILIIMKIHKAIEILRTVNNPAKIIKRDARDPSNFMEVMKELKNPFEHFKTIHITGTNGKGSVAIKTAAIL